MNYNSVTVEATELDIPNGDSPTTPVTTFDITFVAFAIIILLVAIVIVVMLRLVTGFPG